MEQSWIDLVLFTFINTSFLISFIALCVAYYMRLQDNRGQRFLLSERELSNEIKKGERKTVVEEEREDLGNQILSRVKNHLPPASEIYLIDLEVVSILTPLEFISFIEDLKIIIRKKFPDYEFGGFKCNKDKMSMRTEDNVHYYFLIYEIESCISKYECEVI